MLLLSSSLGALAWVGLVGIGWVGWVGLVRLDWLGHALALTA